MTSEHKPGSGDSGDLLRGGDPRWLASLMDPSDAARPAWRPEELGAILRHQLEAPVQVDLATLSDAAAAQVRTISAAQGLLLKSFGDVLHHPHPPVRLLELAKDFAKAQRSHPDSPLPPEVANVLYYAAVVVARVRCGRRISRLDDAVLAQGMRWALAQPWLDAGTAALFREALPQLGTPPAEPGAAP